MSQGPFRFLHAADLHLDQPIGGLAEAPEHLVDLLIDCPLRAAARLFDAAIDQRVDFVVLAGDVVDPRRCGPRELLFLVEQFERLSQRQIVVYWAGGPCDWLEHWPSFIKWPPNVRMFSRHRAERYQHEIAGAPVCELIGRTHDAIESPRSYEFAPSHGELCSMAVVHAEDWNYSALGEIGVNYWAFGGRHERSTPLATNCLAHYPGSPQGRRPSEHGPHGCTLVQVNERRQFQLTPIACDVVRWQSPRLSVSGSTDASGLEQLLRARANELRIDASETTLLVTWKIACQGELFSALRHGSLTGDLIAMLRSDFNRGNPPLWTVDVEAELPEHLPPGWYEEQTLRGDFLRAVQTRSAKWASGDDNVMQEISETVHSLLSPGKGLIEFVEADAGAAPARNVPGGNQRLLNEIAWLGSELLSPEESIQ